MSVDFYVAVPSWPTQAAMQQCLAGRGHRIALTRFPSAKPSNVVNDGILAQVGGEPAYLEGEIYPNGDALKGTAAADRGETVAMINAKLAASHEAFRIGSRHYLLSIRIGGRPSEYIATSYVVSGLIHCFGGFGFEPQGNEYGRASFADMLVDQSKSLTEHAR